METLICPECHEKVIKMPYDIGWVHAPYGKDCALKDGLKWITYDKDGTKFNYLTLNDIEDPAAVQQRIFFLRKFAQMEQDSKGGAPTLPLDLPSEEIVFEPQFNNKKEEKAKIKFYWD